MGRLKRSHDAAVHLAQLLPAGGRAAKLRRSVSHLGEVLVLGAWVVDQLWCDGFLLGWPTPFVQPQVEY